MPLPYDHPYRDETPKITTGYTLYADIGGSNGPVGGGTALNTAGEEFELVNDQFSRVYKHNDTIQDISTPLNQQSVNTYGRLNEAGRYNKNNILPELLRESVSNRVCVVTAGQSATALNNINSGWTSEETKTQIHSLLDAAELKTAAKLSFVTLHLLGKDTTFANANGDTILGILETWITEFRTARNQPNLPVFVIGLGPTPPTLFASNYPRWFNIREATKNISMPNVHYIRTDDLNYADHIHSVQFDGVTPDEVHWNAKGHNEIAKRVHKQLMIHGHLPGLTREKLIADLLGDSMTNQNSAVNVFESLGYFTALQAMLGHRFEFSDANNFGVSSDDTAEMLARITDVTSSDGDFVFFLGCANDRSAKRTSAWSIDNITAMFKAIQAEGKKIIALSCTPRPDSDYISRGFTAQEIIDERVKEVEVDNFLRNYPNVVFADFRQDWIDNIADVTYDGLHPNMLGAFYMGAALYEALVGLVGARNFRSSADNVLSTVIVNETLVIDEAQGTGTEVGPESLQQTNTNYANKYAYYEAEISFPEDLVRTNNANLRGLIIQLRTNLGFLSNGFDRHNETTHIPVNAYRAWCLEKGRNLVLRTPKMLVPSSTYIRGRLIPQANTTLGSVNGSVTLHRAQIVVTDT